MQIIEIMREEKVAPLVGAWIEIYHPLSDTIELSVAPLVGAWIEILDLINTGVFWAVAPLVGAWIEIFWPPSIMMISTSLPSWERGLKSHLLHILTKVSYGRSPRGSVD